MPYRMGRGDFMPGYYGGRGDPGIFSAIGHVLGGAVTGFITGGPLGAIRGAIGGSAVATVSGSHEALLQAGGSQSAYTPELQAAHARALHKGALRSIAARSGAGVAQHAAAGMRGPRRAPRMNPLNIQALRRANRRARGFLRAVRTAVRYYTPKAHKGRPYVHFKKRRAA